MKVWKKCKNNQFSANNASSLPDTKAIPKTYPAYHIPKETETSIGTKLNKDYQATNKINKVKDEPLHGGKAFQLVRCIVAKLEQFFVGPSLKYHYHLCLRKKKSKHLREVAK